MKKPSARQLAEHAFKCPLSWEGNKLKLMDSEQTVIDWIKQLLDLSTQIIKLGPKK